MHEHVEMLTKERRRFDFNKGHVVKKPVEMLKPVDDYNTIVGFDDDTDRLQWNYMPSGHVWRERKWWVPVYVGALRKRVDRAYCLYQIRANEHEQRLLMDESDEGKKAVAEFRSLRWSHADFIYDSFQVVQGFNYALRVPLHVTTASEAIKFPPLGLKSVNDEKALLRRAHTSA
eukprot:216919-Pleurochrysis_carterae.AAC.1